MKVRSPWKNWMTGRSPSGNRKKENKCAQFCWTLGTSACPRENWDSIWFDAAQCSIDIQTFCLSMLGLCLALLFFVKNKVDVFTGFIEPPRTWKVRCLRLLEPLCASFVPRRGVRSDRSLQRRPRPPPLLVPRVAVSQRSGFGTARCICLSFTWAAPNPREKRHF